MKSGTTTLFDYISQHPQIAPCSQKEPDFFANNFEKGYQWYLANWQGIDCDDKILLEASANYSKVPSLGGTAENIKQTVSKHQDSFKFIYIMRDPIERMESHYRHNLSSGWGNKTIDQMIKPDGHLINISKYAMQLDEYYNRFDKETILLLDFNELKNNPEKLLTSVYKFLNIDTQKGKMAEYKAKNISSSKYAVGFVNRIKRRFPLLDRVSKKLPRGLKKQVMKCFGKVPAEISFTPEQKKIARDLLRDDMKKLNELYAFDVSKWGF